MFINKLYILIIFLIFGLNLTGYCEVAIIPQPRSIKYTNKSFEFNENTKIIYKDIDKDVAQYASSILSRSTGYPLQLSGEGKQLDNCLIFKKINDSNLGKEGYRLDVYNNYIMVSANTDNGLFYGFQSLLQLLPAKVYSSNVQNSVRWIVPGVNIVDKPHFKWRAMHLDVSRHFMPIEFVKKFIDLLAIHKFNRFHWHLTDDQGWRIEIKKYPRLTEVGAWRDGTLIGLNTQPESEKKYDGIVHGGYYTQDEIKEVVQYARKRHIDIMPEIEMPGHAQAAIASYPELGCTGKNPGVKKDWGGSKYIFCADENTINFIENVLDEVLELFPSKYIHVGGDEVSTGHWVNGERVKVTMERYNLKDMYEVYGWFMGRINRYLKLNKRTMVAWDEIIEGGIPDEAVVMSWRGNTGAIQAANMGFYTVNADSNYTYFDKYQSESGSEPLAIGGLITLEDVFNFNPVPSELSFNNRKFILGAQGQLWTEYMPNPDHVEYMAFPRECALSEVLWTYKNTNFDNFENRLRNHLKRLDTLNVNYRRPN